MGHMERMGANGTKVKWKRSLDNARLVELHNKDWTSSDESEKDKNYVAPLKKEKNVFSDDTDKESVAETNAIANAID